MRGKNNGPGGNPYGNQGGQGNPYFNPNQGYSPNQYNPNQGYNPNYNPYRQMDINQLIGPPNNYPPSNNPNNFIGNNNQNQGFSGNNSPANLGPNFYVPGDVAPSNKAVNPPRSSINSINDIDYYP